MVLYLLILLLGILFGYIIRNRKVVVRIFNKMTIWVIFMLLFFMGISIGNNNNVMQHLDTIGLRGVQLGLSALLGSAVVSMVVYMFFYRDEKL